MARVDGGWSTCPTASSARFYWFARARKARPSSGPQPDSDEARARRGGVRGFRRGARGWGGWRRRGTTRACRGTCSHARGWIGAHVPGGKRSPTSRSRRLAGRSLARRDSRWFKRPAFGPGRSTRARGCMRVCRWCVWHECRVHGSSPVHARARRRQDRDDGEATTR
jgi:hypothetical protein